MHLSPQIEPASTDRLLHCLGLAIEEVKLVRDIVNARHQASELKTRSPLSERLEFFDSEILKLESRLARVRREATRCSA